MISCRMGLTGTKKMLLLWMIVASALVAGTAAWAMPGSGQTQIAAAKPKPKPQKVWVQDNFFDRRSIQIEPNEKVVWVWKGANRHNVRFTKVPKGAVRGGSKTKSEGRFRRTFKIEGNYRYVCRLFTGMRGSVMVRAEPPESNSTAILGGEQGK
jgi:plastocyanin